MIGRYAVNVHRFFMKHPGSRSAASGSERRAGQGRHMAICLPYCFTLLYRSIEFLLIYILKALPAGATTRFPLFVVKDLRKIYSPLSS